MDVEKIRVILLKKDEQVKQEVCHKDMEKAYEERDSAQIRIIELESQCRTLGAQTKRLIDLVSPKRFI